MSPGASSRAITAACALGAGGQDGLDLAGLDAEPADLDLVIGAAGEDQLPGGGPPGQVPGPVQPPPAARGSNGSATNRAAVSPARRAYPRASFSPATYSSPATPGGTGPSHSSSTNTRVLTTGRPRATCPATGSHCQEVASTVVSVAPHELNIRCPDAHRAIISGENASPAASTVTPAPTDEGSSSASTAGGSVTYDTPCAASSPVSASPNRCSGGTTTSAAPRGSAMHHSQQNVSKLADANCATRSPGPTPSTWSRLAARLANPPCDTTTPLGAPVDPDV